MATKITKDVDFKFEVGSNVIEVNGEKKYLKVIIWRDDVRYKDIEDKIVG